jgi:hypothetical protein
VYHLKIDHLLYATSYNFSPTLLGYFLSFVFCFPPCGLLETFYYNTLTQFCMDNLSYFLSSSQPDPRPSSTFSHHHARAERLLTVSASRRCALSLCATWMEELAGAPSLRLSPADAAARVASAFCARDRHCSCSSGCCKDCCKMQQGPSRAHPWGVCISTARSTPVSLLPAPARAPLSSLLHSQRRAGPRLATADELLAGT